MTELWRQSASELAKLIASKQVSATEVVDAHLARMDALNSQVNAVVRVLADEARSAAVEADRKVASGERIGPLHGVPVTVKENIDMAGLPTTWGVPALSGAVVPVDAPVVERIRAAGGIPIGRTIWGCGYTLTAAYTALPEIHGTATEPRGDRAVGRQWRLRLV